MSRPIDPPQPADPSPTGAPVPKDHPNSRQEPLDSNKPSVSPDDYPADIGGKPDYKHPGKA